MASLGEQIRQTAHQAMVDVCDVLLPQKCLSCDNEVKESPFCAPCSWGVELVNNERLVGEVYSYFSYSGSLRDGILKAKFAPCEISARKILRYWESLFFDVSLESFFGVSNFDCVCFVPAHWRKRIRRGFDFPSLFARVIARKMDLPLVDILRCNRHESSLSLTASKRARKQLNVNRFGTYKTINHKKILLIDDVVTSGSTLTAAQSVLANFDNLVFKVTLARTELKK